MVAIYTSRSVLFCVSLLACVHLSVLQVYHYNPHAPGVRIGNYHRSTRGRHVRNGIRNRNVGNTNGAYMRRNNGHFNNLGTLNTGNMYDPRFWYGTNPYGQGFWSNLYGQYDRQYNQGNYNVQIRNGGNNNAYGNQYRNGYQTNNNQGNIINQKCDDKPSFINPPLCPTIFFRRKRISYHFVSSSEWETARASNDKMSRSSFARENRLVGMLFATLNKLLPWVKFYKARNWQSANIKFRFSTPSENTSLGENVAAHAHVSPYETLAGTICLHPNNWMNIAFFETTLMHEVLHLMGNHDITDPNVTSIMHFNPTPTYKDILTTTYVHFRENYQKYLVSQEVFTRVEKRMMDRYKSAVQRYQYIYQ